MDFTQISTKILSFLSIFPDLWEVKLSGLIFTFFGALGGIILVYQKLKDTFFYKRRWLNNLQQLAPGTTMAFFVSILGTPIFVKKGMQNTKRCVFVHNLFYVEAVTNLDDEVQMFSVTTRSENFNPILILGPYTTDNTFVSVQLGKTKFSELDILGYEGRVESGVGNRRAFYNEEYYFGNPGLYQTYVLSYNDAGTREINATAADLNAGANTTTDPRLKELRTHSVINTYSITAPSINLQSLGVSPWLGADYDQVRVLER